MHSFIISCIERLHLIYYLFSIYKPFGPILDSKQVPRVDIIMSS